MATKKQNYWYVLVLTEGGPVFVTSYSLSPKEAYWKKDEAPKELSADFAKDLALGLTWNGNVAFAVCSKFELDQQPYRYDMGQFEWKMNETENEED